MQANSQDATIAPDITIDAKGLNCPLPILRARKALSGLGTGQMMRVIATDSGSKADFAAFCAQTGHELLSSQESEGLYIYDIRKC